MNQETTPQAGLAKENYSTLAGKYLAFLLQGAEYGVRILKVREIIAMQDVTPLPRMPEYIEGVINLRGRIIPIVDLRLKLGMEAPERTAQTCIIVLEIVRSAESEIAQIGCVVDTVSEVLDIKSNQVEPPPRFGTAISTVFLLGLGKIEEKNKVIALLDIDTVLANSEIAEIAQHVSGETLDAPGAPKRVG